MDSFELDRKYVFYYNFYPKLPNHYFSLVNALKQYQVELLPVRREQVRDLTTSRKVIVVCITSDIHSARQMQKAMDSTLGLLLRHKKVSIFHISSFEKNLDLAPYEKSKHYHYFKLPLSYISIAKSITLNLAESLKVINTWPGGRRAKLPQL